MKDQKGFRNLREGMTKVEVEVILVDRAVVVLGMGVAERGMTGENEAGNKKEEEAILHIVVLIVNHTRHSAEVNLRHLLIVLSRIVLVKKEPNRHRI